MAKGSNKRIERSKYARRRARVAAGRRKVLAGRSKTGRYYQKADPGVVRSRDAMVGGKLSDSGTRTHSRQQPEPGGALFYGGDPTLAKRVEEELYGFGR